MPQASAMVANPASARSGTAARAQSACRERRPRGVPNQPNTTTAALAESGIGAVDSFRRSQGLAPGWGRSGQSQVGRQNMSRELAFQPCAQTSMASATAPAKKASTATARGQKSMSTRAWSAGRLGHFASSKLLRLSAQSSTTKATANQAKHQLGIPSAKKRASVSVPAAASVDHSARYRYPCHRSPSQRWVHFFSSSPVGASPAPPFASLARAWATSGGGTSVSIRPWMEGSTCSLMLRST
jgi:hypothetical protein